MQWQIPEFGLPAGGFGGVAGRALRALNGGLRIARARAASNNFTRTRTQAKVFRLVKSIKEKVEKVTIVMQKKIV